MNASELYRRLSEPFPSADVEWRVTKVHQRSGLAVPYITSRAIQTRLDHVVVLLAHALHSVAPVRSQAVPRRKSRSRPDTDSVPALRPFHLRRGKARVD